MSSYAKVTTPCIGCGIPVTYSPSAKRRYCSRRCHYDSRPKGADHFNWKGGIQKHALGYLIEYKDRKLQHRKVMEDHLGRPLESNEIVHHIDENKKNNEINNLMLISRADHLRIHRLWEWRNR